MLSNKHTMTDTRHIYLKEQVIVDWQIDYGATVQLQHGTSTFFIGIMIDSDKSDRLLALCPRFLLVDLSVDAEHDRVEGRHGEAESAPII
jgi:hypothetical protein